MTEPQTDDLQIVKLLTRLASTYPNVVVSKETFREYLIALRQHPIEVLEVAMSDCRRTCEFFPTIAKIEQAIFKLTSPLAVVPTAADAWGIVTEAISKRGIYNPPQFRHDLINRAVENIGWRTLCSSENQVADRAHFIKIYESLLAREIEDTRLQPQREQLQGKQPDQLHPAGTLKLTS